MADEQTTESVIGKFEVELDERGLPKQMPAPLQRAFDQRVNSAVREALKNAEKKELPPDAKEALSVLKLSPAEREALAAIKLSPAEREELIALRDKASRLEQSAAEHNQQWKDALRIQEERLEAKRREEIAAREEALKARDTRISRYQEQTKLGAIRAAAVAAGARDESLPELEKLLSADIAFDAETDAPYVPGADGSKQPIEQFVTTYLQAHPHHLGRGKGTPGRATGGASFAGRAINTVEAVKESAFAAVAAKPSVANVAAAVGVLRGQR